MRGISRLLYNNNPFYPLSAGCFLFGLRVAFQDDPVDRVWWLAASFGGYTLLLVLTTCLIVRLGKVWDDARTIALVVVLMLIAISASFDHVLVVMPQVAEPVLLAGLLFSIAVCELLIRSIRLVLPWRYRLPFYSIIALLFVFPLCVRHPFWIQLGWNDAWRVMLFPLIAGGLMLLLWPAARAGKSLVAANGTPWYWPWYPWSIFAMLLVGACGRTYLLTIAFQESSFRQSTFGAYYLVPIVAAVIVLLAEIGITDRVKVLRGLVLLLPMGLLAMSNPWQDAPVFNRHFADVCNTIGSPLWLTLLVCTTLYLWMAWRGIAAARWGIFLSASCLCVVSPHTRHWQEWTLTTLWPMVAFGLAYAFSGFRKRSAWRLSVGSAVAVFATSYAIEDWQHQIKITIAAHMLLAITIFASFAFRDWFAAMLRRLTPIATFVFSAAAFQQCLVGRVRLQEASIYLAALVGIAFLIAITARSQMWRLSCGGIAGALIALSVHFALTKVDSNLPNSSVAALGLCGVCFLLGILISIIKAGAGRPMNRWLQRQWLKLIVEWYKPQGAG